MNLIHFLNYINLAKFADNVSKDKTDEQTLNKLFNNDGAGKIRGFTDNTNKTTW